MKRRALVGRHVWTRAMAAMIVLLALTPLARGGAPDTQPSDRMPRLATGMLAQGGSFEGFASYLYAVHNIVVNADQKINAVRLHSPFPEFYEPTREELFDALGRQTGSHWTWDGQAKWWHFARPAKPLPYAIDIAAGWQATDRGEYVGYAPAIAPVGMDVYLCGLYSAPPGEPAALFEKVRLAQALRFGSRMKENLGEADMQKQLVGGAEALYLECATPRPGGVWRQWSFLKDGQAIVIVSAMEKAKEPQILPDVEAMVKSFRFIAGETSPGPSTRKAATRPAERE